ncbi:MAG: hypothetical protein ACRC6T_14510 [Sarcina sp.]
MNNQNTSHIGFCLSIGAALGIIFDNLVLGAGIGVALRAVLDGVKNKENLQ